MVLALLRSVSRLLIPTIHNADIFLAVFGAALTIFGTLLIAPSVAATASPFHDRLEEGSSAIRKASEAVRQLDDNNEVVTRCADFLSEICRLLDQWRKSMLANS